MLHNIVMVFAIHQHESAMGAPVISPDFSCLYISLTFGGISSIVLFVNSQPYLFLYSLRPTHF